MRKFEYTSGPWVAYEKSINENNKHIVIFTEWIQGQLKSPAPIISLSYALTKEGVTSIYLSEEDATLIASAPEMYELLYEIVNKNPDWKNEELEKIKSLLNKIENTQVCVYGEEKKSKPAPYFRNAQIGDRICATDEKTNEKIYGTIYKIIDSWYFKIFAQYDVPEGQTVFPADRIESNITGRFQRRDKDQFLFYATPELEKERGV